MNIRIGLSVLALLIMPTVSADEVADFTFHVPVNIENTILWDISVSCTVIENELLDDGRMAAGSMRLIGRGSTSATVVDGDFNGTLTVLVNAEAGTLPALARSYSCRLTGGWPKNPEVGYEPGVGSWGASGAGFRRAYEENGGRMLLSVTATLRGRIEQ